MQPGLQTLHLALPAEQQAPVAPTSKQNMVAPKVGTSKSPCCASVPLLGGSVLLGQPAELLLVGHVYPPKLVLCDGVACTQEQDALRQCGPKVSMEEGHLHSTRAGEAGRQACGEAGSTASQVTSASGKHGICCRAGAALAAATAPEPAIAEGFISVLKLLLLSVPALLLVSCQPTRERKSDSE